MPMFEKHFTVAEANRLIPWLERSLRRLGDLDLRLLQRAEALQNIFVQRSSDVGGREISDYFALWLRWRELLGELLATGAQIKDLQRGLVDFPHLLDESREEVLLCWQLGEPEVGWWHRLEAGYAGRQPLESPAGSPPSSRD